MALHLTLLCAFLLYTFALAELPQCAVSCMSRVRPECPISKDTDTTLLCSSGHTSAAVSVCAEFACTPDEHVKMEDILRIFCAPSQAQRVPPQQNLLFKIESTDEVAHPIIDTDKLKLRISGRDDDDDDDDDGDGNSSRHSNVGAAVGGTLGGIAAVAALVALFIHHTRRRQRRRRQPKKQRRTEIDPEDPNNQFRPPQVFRPSSSEYDPHSASASTAQPMPLVPPKDAAAGTVAESEGPPAYGHSDVKRSGLTILKADT